MGQRELRGGERVLSVSSRTVRVFVFSVMLALRAHALELPSHLLGRVTCRTKAQACGPSLAAKSCLWAPLSCLSFFRSTSHTAALVQPGRGESAWWAGNQGACRATYAVFCSRLHDVLWGGKLPLLLVTFSTRRA